MGFPIRKSADQSFFAAPHGLSQRSTSFIASQRQGIHQMPLIHLIALIINAHPTRQRIPGGRPSRTCVLVERTHGWTLIRKTSLSSDRSDGERSSSPTYDAGAAMPETAGRWTSRQSLRTFGTIDARSDLLFTMSDNTYSHAAPSDPPHTMSDSRVRNEPRRLPEGATTDAELCFSANEQTPAWWSQTGSNRRPPACKAGALPTELWPRTSQGYRCATCAIRHAGCD